MDIRIEGDRMAGGTKPTATTLIESSALIAGAIAFPVGIAVATAVFGRHLQPISGRDSIGELAALSGGAAAAIAFIGGRLLASRIGPRADHLRVGPALLRWLDAIAMALAHTVTALFGWLGIASVLQYGFRGAVVFPTPGAILVAAAIAVTAYGSFLSGANLTPAGLSLVLILFLAVGVLAATLSTSDVLWWEKNLSALGMTHDISSRTFNVTLIIAGVIVTTIARYAAASLPSSTSTGPTRRSIFFVLLSAIGVFLAAIGLFPVDRYEVAHNTAVVGLVVCFVAVAASIPWLAPGMPRIFEVLGYLYVAAIAPLGLLFAGGSYNLTAVELVAAVLVFSWIIILLRNIDTTPDSVAESDDDPAVVPAARRHSRSG